jgi:CO dehydrogenase/acetyl-CoA synthase beta subunit
MAEPLKLKIKEPLKLKLRDDKGKGTGEISAGTLTSSAGGITVIFKNAKIHAEKVIIKRSNEK